MSTSEGESHFRAELHNDERTLWTGQPELFPLFAWSDLFFIPFAIFFLAMGLGPATTELVGRSRFGIPFLLMGIFFTLAGLYGLVGRFVIKIFTRRHTYYAETNQRVLVLRLIPHKALVSGYLDEIPTMAKDIRRHGRGTITFGNGFPGHASGDPDPFGILGPFGPLTLAFVNVKDVEKIYTLIDSAKRPRDRA